jgi:hypothetical protein
MSLKKEFHKTLKQVQAEMRDWDETDNTQLAQFGEKHFGKQFGGVFPEDYKVNFNSNKCYYIFNNDKAGEEGCHWLGVYVNHKDRTVYIFDTFNRQSSQMLPDVLIEAKKKHFKCKKGALDVLQTDAQEDCGQRSLTYLLLVKKYGADYVRRHL